MSLISEKAKWKEKGVDFDLDPNLKQYKDDPWVFVHFSEHAKIGINPGGGDGKTPLGIYGWPLKDLWSKFELKGGQGLYAGTRRYMIVFRILPEYRSKFMVFEWGSESGIADSPLSPDEFAKATFETIRDRFGDHYADGAIKEFEKNIKYGTSIAESVWSIVKAISIAASKGNSSFDMTSIFRAIGIEGFYDRGTGTIYTSEPFQLVSLSIAPIELLSITDTKRELDSPSREVRNFGENLERKLRMVGLELRKGEYDIAPASRDGNKIRSSWGITMHMPGNDEITGYLRIELSKEKRVGGFDWPVKEWRATLTFQGLPRIHPEIPVGRTPDEAIRRAIEGRAVDLNDEETLMYAKENLGQEKLANLREIAPMILDALKDAVSGT